MTFVSLFFLHMAIVFMSKIWFSIVHFLKFFFKLYLFIGEFASKLVNSLLSGPTALKRVCFDAADVLVEDV